MIPNQPVDTDAQGRPAAARRPPLVAGHMHVMPLERYVGERRSSESIHWELLARDLGLLRDDGESSGSEDAKRALELIVGEDVLRQSVEYYIANGAGSELARSVLWLLRPWSAMDHCYQIFKSSRPLDDRRAAVELVRVVADGRALPWAEEFLRDPDAQIQVHGAGLLDQLLWSELVEPAAAEPQLRLAEAHLNEGVLEKARFIREFLRVRNPTPEATG